MTAQSNTTQEKSGLENSAWRVANKLADWVPLMRRLLDESAQKYSRVARTYYEDGDESAAITYYKKAHARSPQNIELLSDLAQLCYQNNRFDEAEHFYRLVLDEDYFNERALKGLGFTLHSRGDSEEALYIYLRYLNQNRNDVDVLLNLSALFFNSQDYDKAIEFAHEAAAIDPKLGGPHQNLAASYFNLGQFEEAETSVRHALALEPTADSYTLLGLLLETENKLDEALDVYRKATDINPNDPEAHLAIARILNSRGEYPEYLERALKAAELYQAMGDKTGLGSAYWDVGWAYYELGQWEKSAEASRKALENDPTLVPPRFNLGHALLQLGKPDEAKKEYFAAIEKAQPAQLKTDGIDDLQDALEKNPNLKGAREILDKLLADYDALDVARKLRPV